MNRLSLDTGLAGEAVCRPAFPRDFTTMLFRIVVLLFFVVLPAALVVGEEPAKNSEDRETIWTGALPVKGPLDVELLGEMEEDGIAVQRLRYTGLVCDGKSDRIYALYAAPTGDGPFPAILQVHGGGQSCYPNNLAYFVKRGYACLSFDWTGPRDGERRLDRVTDWGEAVNDNLLGNADNSLENVVLYHAVVAGIRGIDVLCLRPEVDRNRVGVQGISWGGLLVWLINAIDPRVKAAVPTYGIGDVVEHQNEMGASLRKQNSEWQRAWAANFDPAHYAARQLSPVMYLDGANDFWGPLDIAERRLAQLTVPYRRSYSPNRMHSLDPESVEAGMAWFDAHLKDGKAFPAEPKLKVLVTEDGLVQGRVSVDSVMPVKRVRIDYSRGPEPPLTRCWLSKEAVVGADGAWQAEIPIVRVDDRLMAMAQVIYENGAMLTSPVVNVVPQADLPGATGTESPADVISAWDNGTSGWYISRGTDFLHAGHPVAELRAGVLSERPAIIYDSQDIDEILICTRLTSDPARNPGGRRRLEFWTHDMARVTLRKDWFLRRLETPEYEAHVYLAQGGPIPASELHEARARQGAGWRRHVVSLDQLEEVGWVGRAPKSWDPTYQLTFQGKPVPGGQPGIGLVQWID